MNAIIVMDTSKSKKKNISKRMAATMETMTVTTIQATRMEEIMIRVKSAAVDHSNLYQTELLTLKLIIEFFF